jgi:hypothetical protein
MVCGWDDVVKNHFQVQMVRQLATPWALAWADTAYFYVHRAAQLFARCHFSLSLSSLYHVGLCQVPRIEQQ